MFLQLTEIQTKKLTLQEEDIAKIENEIKRIEAEEKERKKEKEKKEQEERQQLEVWKAIAFAFLWSDRIVLVCCSKSGVFFIWDKTGILSNGILYCSGTDTGKSLSFSHKSLNIIFS